MIDGFEVLNYRSVLGKGPQGENKPARLELEEDITTLIGKNEAGKSNILSAINLLGDQYPISGDDLSSYETYNGPLRSVEVLRCRLDPRVLSANAEDIKPIPWLLGPHWKDDLDGFPVRIPINKTPPLVDNSVAITHEDQSVANKQSKQTNPSAIGQALARKNIELVHYASGDLAVDIVQQDGTSIDISTHQSRPNLELPMEIDSFLVERHREHLHLCWWFIQNVAEVSELNPEVDEIDSINPADINDISEAHHAVKRQLESISTAFDNATPIEEPDLDSNDEVTYEPPEVSEIQQGADGLLRTLSNVFNPSDPLADLPNIIDQSQIELAKSEYNLRESRSNLALQGLLALDNIEITNYSSYDSSDLRTSLDNAVDRLSDYLNKFWEFDPVEGVSGGTIDPDETERYEFSYELDGEILRIRLSEEDGPPIPLEQRSDGMRWIITFLLKILAQPYDQSEGRQTLVILDDPGIHLHPEAEKQLFSAFFYITTQAQIVYSTHSPALIDSKEMARLRIIKRNTTRQEDDPIGTTVANNFSTSQSRLVRTSACCECDQTPAASRQ
ncbi:AAA family ATPase [Halorubrum xinjiangense]|uniref:AAA family ATPase n=1 Tax=Halorubrum xinjiangense TaxID=261291 RepID=UPI003C6ED651